MKPEDDRSPEQRDDIATLIRLAGRRRAVPEEVASRVRAAAHEHWQRELRRRSRARFLWTATGLAAAAALALAIASGLFRAAPPRPPVPGGTVLVESLVGPVSLRDGREARPLAIGAEVPIGSEIETGEEGRVAVRLASGHSVRLDGASRLRLLDRAALTLDRGAAYVDSGAHARAAEPLGLRTPLGEVRETGTQFEVRLTGDAVRIRVREGAVVLLAADGRHEVGAETELLADGRGGARTRGIARHGPGWDWIAGVTPLPDLDGLSARAFLDRIAREGGWTLSFADDEAARIAAATVLRGSVKGLTRDQALEAVLPTCGLAHRIDGGRLIVERSAT